MLIDTNSALVLNEIGAAQGAALAIKDLDHRFLYVNNSFCEAIGLNSEDLIGKDDLEIGRPNKMVLGDSTSGWPGLWALDDQVVKDRAPLRSTDAGAGRSATTETVRIPVMNDDVVVALLVQVFDVSEVRDLKRRVASNIDALSLREDEISTMESVLASLMACQDTNTLLSELAKILIERTHADGAYAATLHDSGDYMQIVAANGTRSSDLLGLQFERGVGTLGEAWHKGESIYLHDVSGVDTSCSWPVGTQAFSLPLFVENEAVAALTVISDQESEDLATDIPLLQRICGMATMAIANTRLIDATKQRLKGTRALAEISQLLTTLVDVTEACSTVSQILLPALDATRASVVLVDENGKLYSNLSWGYARGLVNRASSMSLQDASKGIAQWCIEHDQIATIGRLEEDPRESAAVHAARAENNIGSTCCIPMKKQGHVFGAMLLSRSRDMGEFSETHIDIYKAVVNQLSTAIERMELAQELGYQAFHDRLTDLPNRHHFERFLDYTIAQAEAEKHPFNILFIDLDGFKEVNDSLGHAIGDSLLFQVARRLSQSLGDLGILSRMGGDEFAAILNNGVSGTDTANLLLTNLSSKFLIEEESLSIGASIGISQFPDNGNCADSLLQSADEAMYQAKRAGRGCAVIFDESLAAASRELSLLETQLQQAIVNKEFYLLYQPQVRCRDNQVVGLEALIRWKHPTRGLVPPSYFIPVAENSGLVNEIGTWVINESVRQLAQWQNTAIKNLRMCINIATPQFELDDFCDQIIEALDRYYAPAHLLELEVTESVLMNDVAVVVDRLEKLRRAGVRIAIDDFGTGYSSLSYLQDLPLDVLKIDHSFVKRLNDESTKTSLIDTIQTLATSLGLETVAEGVELPEQVDKITSLGCDFIQGFLYSRPVPAYDVPSTVRLIQNQMSAKAPLQRVTH